MELSLQPIELEVPFIVTDLEKPSKYLSPVHVVGLLLEMKFLAVLKWFILLLVSVDNLRSYNRQIQSASLRIVFLHYIEVLSRLYVRDSSPFDEELCRLIFAREEGFVIGKPLYSPVKSYHRASKVRYPNGRCWSTKGNFSKRCTISLLTNRAEPRSPSFPVLNEMCCRVF